MTLTQSIFHLFSKRPINPLIRSGLDAKFAKLGNSVEKCFCEKFAELPCLKSEEQKLILQFMALPQWFESLDLTFEQHRLLNVMREKMKKCLTVLIQDRALYMLAQIADRPAVAVMYVAYIQYWAHKNTAPYVDFDMVRKQIFPNGFPDEPRLKDIWYSQKIDHIENDSDNLLDYPAAYGSIQL